MSLLQKIDRKKKTFKNSCPTNSELIDGVCYDPCPNGYILDPNNKKKCIIVSENINRKKISDPVLQCPSGYEDLNGKCYKLCSGDFVESQDKTMCISKDFTTTKNREFVNLQPLCEPNYVLDQATGKCLETCSGEWLPNNQNSQECLKTGSNQFDRNKVNLQCPDGTLPINDTCYRPCDTLNTGNFIFEYSNLNENTDTTCSKYYFNTESTADVCPDGTINIGGNCFNCSEGYTFNTEKTKCIKNDGTERYKENLQCIDAYLAHDPTGINNPKNYKCYTPCATGQNPIIESNTPKCEIFTDRPKDTTTCPTNTTFIDGQCFGNCLQNNENTAYATSLNQTGLINHFNNNNKQCPGFGNDPRPSNTNFACSSGTLVNGICYDACPTGSTPSSDGTKCVADPVLSDSTNKRSLGQYTQTYPGATNAAYDFNALQNCPTSHPNKQVLYSGQPNQQIQCKTWSGNFLTTPTGYSLGQCTSKGSTYFVKNGGDGWFYCMKCQDGYTPNTSTGKCEKTRTTNNTKQCSTSGNTLINNKCYEACPTNTTLVNTNDTQCRKFVAINKTAISDQDRCTRIGKTLINGACYDACSSGKTIAPDTTKCLEKQNRLIDNSKLRPVNSNHNMIGEYAYGDCPPDYIAENRQTSVKCLKQIDRNESNKICPPGYVRNTTNNTCVKACEDGYTLQYKLKDAICMSETQEGRPTLPKTCPTGYDEQINSMCYQNCENVQTSDRTKCVTTSLNSSKTREQKEPTYSCPDNSIRIDPDSDGGNTAQCFYPCELSSDPNFSVYTVNTTCKTKTKQTREITQKINKCPDKSVFLNNTCLEECPEGFTVDEQTGLLCVPITKESKDRTSKSSIRLCESNEELINNECYEVCPTGYSLDPQDKTKCIKDSAESKEEEEESFIEKNLIYIIIAVVILLILLGVGIFFIMKKNPEIQNI